MAAFNGSNVEAFIVGPDGERTPLGQLQSISADITYTNSYTPIERVYELGRVEPYVHPNISVTYQDNSNIGSNIVITSRATPDTLENALRQYRYELDKIIMENVQGEFDRLLHSLGMLCPSPQHPYTKKDRTAFNSIER